jgi:hypothetical protein
MPLGGPLDALMCLRSEPREQAFGVAVIAHVPGGHECRRSTCRTDSRCRAEPAMLGRPPQAPAGSPGAPHRNGACAARNQCRSASYRQTRSRRKYDDGFAQGSLARFFNSANARPARRPSLVAVESSGSAWSLRPRLECGEPAAETGELVRRQLGNGFGDFFDFHVAQYGTAVLIERRTGIGLPPLRPAGSQILSAPQRRLEAYLSRNAAPATKERRAACPSKLDP